MKLDFLERKIEIPEGVEVNLEGGQLVVSGLKGRNSRLLKYPGISIDKKNNQVVVSAKKVSRSEKRLIGTYTAHVRNMIYGVKDGYTYKLKICSGHFPMKVAVEGDKVVINNFLGEKIPRTAKVLDDVKVEISGDEVTVEGVDLEKVGQTAANIERSTRITNRDRRVFQDGCYITSKAKDKK
ncbi:MAG: 50S ribosomal protein L6 [Candidatus Woesearchaeota archaeon]